MPGTLLAGILPSAPAATAAPPPPTAAAAAPSFLALCRCRRLPRKGRWDSAVRTIKEMVIHDFRYTNVH